MVVHFPIALLLISALFDLLGVVLRKTPLHLVGFWTLLIGGIGLLVSLASGEEASGPAIVLGMGALVQQHKLFASLSVLLFGLLALARLIVAWRSRQWPAITSNGDVLLGWARSHRTILLVYFVVTAAAVACLGITGYLGGELAYSHNPVNPAITPVPPGIGE